METFNVKDWLVTGIRLPEMYPPGNIALPAMFCHGNIQLTCCRNIRLPGMSCRGDIRIFTCLECIVMEIFDGNILLIAKSPHGNILLPGKTCDENICPPGMFCHESFRHLVCLDTNLFSWLRRLIVEMFVSRNLAMDICQLTIYYHENIRSR